eukprot:1591958-Prymnesium_polylepis.1
MCGRRPHANYTVLDQLKCGLLEASVPILCDEPALLLMMSLAADVENAHASACTWRASPPLVRALSSSFGAGSDGGGVQSL